MEIGAAVSKATSIAALTSAIDPLIFTQAPDFKRFLSTDCILTEAAFAAAKEFKGKPTAIIAKSIKGKGVSFMEDQCSWHGKAPSAEEYEQAMSELNAKLMELEA